MRRLFTAPRVTAGVTLAALVGLAVAVSARPAPQDKPAEKPAALEHAMFGGTPARNFVLPLEKFAPVQLMPVKEDEKVVKPADAVIKWQADLGSRAYGGPTIAGGKVFIGTNNEKPRNPRDAKKNADGDVEPIDLGILMCFEEATGKFLWQSVHDKLPGGPVVDWPKEGICSSPLVEGDRVYYVSNRCTLVCADVNGAANGRQGKPLQFLAAPDFKKLKPAYDSPTDADILWEVDMIGTLGVFPHNMSASSPLLVGDILYVVTANGVDEGHINIPSPQAPSFLAVDKKTGKVLWTRSDPGKQIMHGQWSNPCYADIQGVRQVISPAATASSAATSPRPATCCGSSTATPRTRSTNSAAPAPATTSSARRWSTTASCSSASARTPSTSPASATSGASTRRRRRLRPRTSARSPTASTPRTRRTPVRGWSGTTAARTSGSSCPATSPSAAP